MEIAETFKIFYKSTWLNVQTFSLLGGSGYRVYFPDAPVLVITTAMEDNGNQIWISEDGRRKREAAQIGMLIEKYFE